MAAFVAAFDLGFPGPPRDLSSAAGLLVPSDGAPQFRHRPGASILQARFQELPEDSIDQVAEDQAGRLCVGDIRLDNRGDLLERLGAGHLRNESDAALVLAAYGRWSHDCLRYLLGDFGFVVWDASARRVFGAVDPIGIRGLRYWLDSDQLVVGTTTRAVAVCAPGMRRLAREPIERYLADGNASGFAEGTPFADVQRLPAGYAFTATDTGLRRWRYARVGENPPERVTDDREYAERLRWLLTQSVRARMRACGPVAFALSGGLDSSSLVCVAHRLALGDRNRVGSRVRTYSVTYPNFPQSDEGHFQAAVAKACPEFVHTSIESDDWYFKPTSGAFVVDEIAPGAQRSGFMTVLGAVRQDGARVFLSGLYGDQVLGPVNHWTRLLDADRAEVGAEVRRAFQPGLVAGLMAVARAGAVALGGTRLLNQNAVLAPPPLPSSAALISYWMVFGPSAQMALRSGGAAAANAGVSYRHPFLDRRVVEFLLHVPARLRVVGGRRKHVLREAMRGYLPEIVRTRQDTITPDDVVNAKRGWEQDRIRAMIRESPSVRAGLISGPEALQRLDRWLENGGVAPTRALGRVLAVDEWLLAVSRLRHPSK